MLPEISPQDLPGGHPMPWSILLALFGGIVVMALVMQGVRSTWKAALLALAFGAMAVPMRFSGLAFWSAFYAPWLLGMVFGLAVGALAREERLTALLLVVSAALAAVPPLWPYKSATRWQPPWTSTDVFLITFVELFTVPIFTWLVAASLLLALALLIAGPVNLIGLMSAAAPPGQTTLRDTVNGWFKDRLQIVFGILGVVSEVGSSRAERETARLKSGLLSPRLRDR